MFPVLAPILESKIEIIKAYCDWTGIFCRNLSNSQWILLQYGSFCREFPIFEYIRYSNMKLNEYGIFEYAKNGHSLGALMVMGDGKYSDNVVFRKDAKQADLPAEREGEQVYIFSVP